MRAERGTAPVAEIGDDAFAVAVHDLLVSEPGTAERSVRLGAVEARQMARADARFRAHASERGLAAVSGGLYLVRAGEPVQGSLGPHGVDALRGAVKELSARGDEGRARALYDLLLQIAPEPDRRDLRAHVAALEAWTRDAVASGGPVASAGGLERAAVHRRLLEPSQEALTDAAGATTEWIQRAVTLRDKFRKTRQQPPRDEGAEAWRALETGPVVLAALYLRDADMAGAMAALDRAQARELLESERPPFAQALEAAAKEGSVDRCIDLLHQLRPLTGREPAHADEDFQDDRDLFGAAAFGVAAECYRLDPTVPEVALTLGVALEELGMAEATPAVLVEATKAHPESRVASEALTLLLDAMASEEEAGDADAARRAFRAAQPLLAVASDKALVGKVHPGAARVRAAMGEIELREGRLDDARVLLKQSADEEPSGGVLLSLARIEWRDAQTQASLDHLRAALETRDAARDPALRGEILLTISDVTREKGDVAGARTPLNQALKELVESRRGPAGEGGASGRARVERVLSRVLDRFGAAQPAQRALERAYEAAPGDKRQLTQTVELLIGRAFVRGDLATAREGLRRALAADLDGDDLVYFSLWVKLLERQLHQASDGTADRVLASVPDDGRWAAVLARFGEGKLKGEDLVARATTPIQKYEALFYAAMDHRAAGDAKGTDDLLRQVVAGTGLELSEVTLARDMLDTSRPQVGGPLPPDVSIP
jgi:tetratricopeptide (TPR) repeat protein